MLTRTKSPSTTSSTSHSAESYSITKKLASSFKGSSEMYVYQFHRDGCHNDVIKSNFVYMMMKMT